MALDDSHRTRPSRDGVGDAALACGVVALVFVFVPIIGDLVTVPAALAAMMLALVDIVRQDRGVAISSGRALTGGLLGAIAAFITLVTFAAMGTFG
jgi:hypothetical protein